MTDTSQTRKRYTVTLDAAGGDYVARAAEAAGQKPATWMSRQVRQAALTAALAADTDATPDPELAAWRSYAGTAGLEQLTRLDDEAA